MNHEETKTLLRVISANYPNFKPDNMAETVAVWERVLAQDSYKEMEMALYTYMREDQSGFAPSTGQLVAKAQWIKDKIQNAGLTEGEAWALVHRAIGDSYYHSRERYAELPEAVQRAVGSPETLKAWGQSDIDAIGTVVYSQFLKAYRNVMNEKHQENLLADSVRRVIAEKRMQLLES